MDDKSRLNTYFKEIKQRGLTPERETRILKELSGPVSHGVLEGDGANMDRVSAGDRPPKKTYPLSFYEFHDLFVLQQLSPPSYGYVTAISTLDELLERDRQREKDGFPRKIRVGRLVKPGKGGKGKVVVVPTTVEEKLIHDSVKEPEEGEAGGSGKEQEGEIIGEEPVREKGESGAGPGEGDDASHEMESSAYDLGKILTERFELPNLKDKGKKHSLTRYTYDMTDKHRGFGQILDKKATLKKILETNIGLGRVDVSGDIDSTEFLISPMDKIYRILSREKDYESQAVVFFLRDYSGSMGGKPTELVVAQHVMIYSWLLYQYDKQVESRFILHDTQAKEVKDFYTYYNSKVAGGTKVASAFKLVNEIVENENLERDYNIYVFHGTDGDDWDTDGKETVPAIQKMLGYANRVGITIAQRPGGGISKSEVERYMVGSKLLVDKKDLIRLDVMDENAEESRIIEGIKKLIS